MSSSKLAKIVSKLLKNNKKSAKICEICVKTFNFLKKFYKICNLLAHLAENPQVRHSFKEGGLCLFADK
ncbi:MAG TPA: hypothetical protein DDW84_03640 [Phycisphaerales bacterium]|nr:MAG: hypothetical protein A2Y13_12230 [Planctomycetes bacterium GWC2_45_44]HBG77929.1 hypothetical protein [Phycisphaerales bacterium]HBR20262.1 hypothetical protein [Phycisphaerales bacterium]